MCARMAQFCCIVLFAWVSVAASAEASLLSAETMLADDGRISNSLDDTASSLKSKVKFWMSGPQELLVANLLVSVYPVSSTSTSGSSLTFAGSVQVAIATESKRHASNHVVAYLRREMLILISPPFLDGIFRPPRQRS